MNVIFCPEGIHAADDAGTSGCLNAATCADPLWRACAHPPVGVSRGYAVRTSTSTPGPQELMLGPVAVAVVAVVAVIVQPHGFMFILLGPPLSTMTG
jgi:hypothetical protein